MFKNIYKQFIYFFKDLLTIIKNKYLISIWLFILPFNIIITILNLLIGVIFYLKFIFILIFKTTIKKLKYKKIKPIQIKKKNLYFKNHILQTLYFLIIDSPIKKSFLILYNQIYIWKNLKKNNNKFFNKIKDFFEIIIIIIIKRSIFYLTSIPFFVLKNNNELTFLIKDIYDMNCKTYNIFISTICANIIKNFNLINNFEVKKLKIKFDKKEIYLNPPKPSNFLLVLNNTEELGSGTKILIKTGIFAMIKYNIDKSNYTKPHPTLLYKITKSNKETPIFLSINQTTKENLNITEIKESLCIKKSIENKIKMTGILKKDTTAYAVSPHWIEKNLIEFTNSDKLIYNWGKNENWIKQFTIVQSILLNLDNEMLKVDKNHGIMIDKDYKTIRHFIEINYEWFDKSTQTGLENIIFFYDNNKDLFNNENFKLNFRNCLTLAEIDPEIKTFFKNILDKHN